MASQLFAAFTIGDIQRLDEANRAEFKRGRDKQKRKKRSLSDNILGTTTGGRIARGLGAVGVTGALALGGRTLLRKRASAINATRLPGKAASKALPGAGQTTQMSRTESSVGAIGGKGRTGISSEVNRVKPNYETKPMSYRPSGGYRSNNSSLNPPPRPPSASKGSSSSKTEEGSRGQKFWFKK